MSAPALKVGDLVTLLANNLGEGGERFVVIGLASKPVPNWTYTHARQTPVGNYVVPDGYHVQSLDNGRLTTYSGPLLERTGKLADSIDGLLPRARATFSAPRKPR